MNPESSLVAVISDGIRGHVVQSTGIARAIARRSGAEVVTIETPRLAGMARLRAKLSARGRLIYGSRRGAREWLESFGGDDVVRELDRHAARHGISEGEPARLLLISAGTAAALYNIAMGHIWDCSCATVMTPSVVGTAPFDFAIVPDHDLPRAESNVLATVGAPNLVVRDEIVSAGAELLRAHPPESGERWAVLVGGDDKNYRISDAWVRDVLGRVFAEAETRGADIYLTTSRRTSPEAERAIRRLAAASDRVRFALYASQDQTNPVPAMLGACGEVFITDDSVNMISEGATAGHRVVVLEAERAGGVRRAAQGLCARLASWGVLPRGAVWGVQRFAATVEKFRCMGLAISLDDWLRGAAPHEPAPEFNEASRAAEFILSRLS